MTEKKINWLQSKNKVLIVDFEPLIRRYIMSCVVPVGNFEVIEASGLQEAITQAEVHQPLVVIFDLMLQDLNPEHFIRYIRSFADSYYPYLIATSIIKDDERTKRAYDSGADYYLEKNFKCFELAGILRNIVRHHLNTISIKENELKYRSLFQLTSEPVILADTSTHITVAINGAGRNLLGLEPADSDLIQLSELTSQPGELIELLSQRPGFAAGIWLKKANGTTFQAQASFAYFEQHGKTLVIMSVNDLTQQLQSTEERIALDDYRQKTDQEAAAGLLAYLAGEENERRRISREIHDHVGQIMVSAKLSLEGLLFHPLGNPLIQSLTNIRDRLVEAIVAIRNIAYKVEHDDNQHVYLKQRIDKLAETLQGNGATHLNYHWHGNGIELSSFVESNIFRICEESLTNALKHSGHGHISLDITNEENQFLIELNNPVMKSRPGSAHHGMGIRIMQQRAHLIGAEMKITETNKNFKVTLLLKHKNHSK